MQWKWNAWLHMPHATVHSSADAADWFAWHSMPAPGVSAVAAGAGEGRGACREEVSPRGGRRGDGVGSKNCGGRRGLRVRGGARTKIHDVVATDGAVVHHDVPRPQRHGVPLQADVSARTAKREDGEGSRVADKARCGGEAGGGSGVEWEMGRQSSRRGGPAAPGRGADGRQNGAIRGARRRRNASAGLRVLCDPPSSLQSTFWAPPPRPPRHRAQSLRLALSPPC